MSKRLPCPPAPGPLEEYAKSFDDLFGTLAQRRSFQYVDDLVEGAFRLMKSSENRPVNIGNPIEYEVGEIARMVIELSGSESDLVHEALPEDDPKRRCPDITRAKEALGWEPRISAGEGLKKTLQWFAERSGPLGEAATKR